MIVAGAHGGKPVVIGRGAAQIRLIIAWALRHRPDLVEAAQAHGNPCPCCLGSGIVCRQRREAVR